MNKEVLYDQIVQRDPLLKWICLKRKWTNRQVILRLSVLSGFLFLVPGGVASWMYKGPGKSILHRDNLGFILAWLLIFIPIMWGAYLWQARTAPKIFADLVENGTFGQEGSESRHRMVKQINQLLFSLSRLWIYLFVILLLAAFWLNEYFYTWPQQFRISEEYWYEVKWYLPVHILVWSISLYALFITVLRQVLFVLGLSKIFKNVDIEVKLLHPDEVGGMSALGDFVGISTLFAIGIGFIAALFALQIFLTGSNLLLRTDVLALFALYLVLVPVCLLIPVFSARSAMLRSREKFLAPVSKEIQQTVEVAQSRVTRASAEELEELNKKIEQLQELRETMLQGYATLPLSLKVFRNFSITATIPLVSGAASVAIQLLTK
jgi:hypothetical protein